MSTRIDADNPQRAKFALFLAAVTIGVLTGLDDGLFGNPEYFTPSAVVTLGLV